MRPTLIIATAAAFTALPMLAGPAWAQANRTFVSGHGSDSNPCSLADPCRSFAQALTQTNAGGEITVLDSAGYGTLTIDRSITITNPGGVEAGITTTAGGTAILMNTSSSIVVTLRGLTLEGGRVGLDGIVFEPAGPGTLNIIDCVVKDFTRFGIRIEPAFGSPAQANVLIANSFVLNNGGSGIEIKPLTAGTDVEYAINHTTSAGNGTSMGDAGILVDDSFGSLNGVLSEVNAQINNIGASFVGGTVTGNSHTSIKHSVFTNNSNSLDLSETSRVLIFLLDSNEIDFITNNNIDIMSDGTNDIKDVVGNPVQPFSRR